MTVCNDHNLAVLFTMRRLQSYHDLTLSYKHRSDPSQWRTGRLAGLVHWTLLRRVGDQFVATLPYATYRWLFPLRLHKLSVQSGFIECRVRSTENQCGRSTL